MTMQKLNISARQCLNPNCHELPSIQLNRQKIVGGSVLYTAAQALVCEVDVAYGNKTLERKFPDLHTEQTRNPGWLLREQQRLLASETQVQGENAPATLEGLITFRDKFSKK